MIYRLITRGTIEERMMQMTKKKMILEHLVVGRLKAQTVNQVCTFCAFLVLNHSNKNHSRIYRFKAPNTNAGSFVFAVSSKYYIS